jgi:O-antigen/teichoic acid export membrane protein
VTAAPATVQTPTATSVFKPAMMLMAGQAVAFVVTFFIPVILARALTAVEFGTYKQIFLLYSTAYLIGQAGMASSLYYFIPRAPHEAGRYAANAMVVLAAAGLAGLGVFLAIAPRLASWMSNPDLRVHAPWIGIFLWFMLAAAPLEIVLVARGHYAWASAAYAASDIARAVALIVPVLVFHRFDWIMRGAALVAGLRVIAMLGYLWREYRSGLRPDGTLLKKQFAYAIPFALAVVVETVQASLPQYVASYLYDPTAVAILAVGCLQIPLVSLAASPTSDVMMVRMQECLTEGRNRAVLAIWQHTTRKLALFLFPLVACLGVLSREVITFLFTARYAASIPLFVAWLGTIVLTTLQVDGVMRVYARTRFLFLLNVARLAVIAVLIRWLLMEFGLLGAILAAVAGTLVFKIGALIRMRRWMTATTAELLPWKYLSGLTGACIVAGLAAWLAKASIAGPLFVVLIGGGLVFASVFAALAWFGGLISDDERESIRCGVRRVLGDARVLKFREG